MKLTQEDHITQKPFSSGQGILKPKINLDNHDVDAMEVKLEQEELLIKDEPKECSSLEINKYDTNSLTLGIRDRTTNTEIKADSSEMDRYVNSKLQNQGEQYLDTKSEQNMDNHDDFNELEMKLEQEELIIKDELEECISLEDIKYDTNSPTFDISDRTTNTEIKADSSEMDRYVKSKLQNQGEQQHLDECSTSYQDILKSEQNVDNHDDFNELEMKLEQEELIIKDESEEVAEENNSLKIIEYDTNPPTLGIRDPVTKNEIKVDSSICTVEALLKVCTCGVEVIRLPDHVFTSKLNQYFNSKLQNLGEQHEDCMIQVTPTSDFDQNTFKCKLGTRNVPLSSLKRHMLHHKKTKRKHRERENVLVQTKDLVHENKKRFKCQLCHKCFNLNSNLKTHMAIHENMKRFKCRQCNKCFNQKRSLKKHMLIHKNKKPFKCQVCRKCFRRNDHLAKHMLFHESRKYFKCQECNKCFTDNSNFKRHLLIHENKQSFKCQLCNKSFNQNRYLKTHMLVHEDKKPFNCQLCDKSFRQKVRLTKHMLFH